MTTPMPADDIDTETETDTAKRLPLGVALMCPHCGTRAHIRTSRQVTETYREGWAICTGKTGARQCARACKLIVTK